MNEIGRNKQDVLHGEVWGVQERSTINDRVEGEEHLLREMYGRLREQTGIKTYLHAPVHYTKTRNLPLRVGNLAMPARRKRHVYQQSGGGGKDAPICDLVAKQRVELTLWENVKCTRRNGMCWRWGNRRM